ncbi:hypothetical protein B566_EDAN004341 [Ephemera danica]|nr:hypothetical protein B566_EDAN004341 [Ephemera danica]
MYTYKLYFYFYLNFFHIQSIFFIITVKYYTQYFFYQLYYITSLKTYLQLFYFYNDTRKGFYFTTSTQIAELRFNENYEGKTSKYNPSDFKS